MVEQLARFLGVSCDKAQLESLTEHCHQLVDQCCNAEALPVGRGTRPCPSLPPPLPRPRAQSPPCRCPWPPTSVFCPVSHFSRALCSAGGQKVFWKLGLFTLLLLCVVTQQMVC